MSKRDRLNPNFPNFVMIMGAAVAAIAAAALVYAMFVRVIDIFIPEAPTFIESATGGISTLNPPRQLDDFTLTAHTGDPFSLSDLRGKVVVLSFGYTYCPDVCPLTLTEYSRMQDALGEDAEKVQFVFISVDGERDTPERLDMYLDARRVNDFTVALTGTEGELRSMGADYGLYFEKQFDTGSQAFYLVDHTASTYIIDQEGRLTNIAGFGTETDLVLDEVRSLID